MRKHRHRWGRKYDGGLVEFVFCKARDCEFSYDQMLLFDAGLYEVAA